MDTTTRILLEEVRAWRNYYAAMRDKAISSKRRQAVAAATLRAVTATDIMGLVKTHSTEPDESTRIGAGRTALARR